VTQTDSVVLVLYLALVLGVGLFFRVRKGDHAEFFLAGRSMGWVPVGLSVMVTVFSAINYVALPNEVFGYGLYVIAALPVFFLAAAAMFSYVRLDSLSPAISSHKNAVSPVHIELVVAAAPSQRAVFALPLILSAPAIDSSLPLPWHRDFQYVYDRVVSHLLKSSAHISSPIISSLAALRRGHIWHQSPADSSSLPA
jgi:hypothetical protein